MPLKNTREVPLAPEEKARQSTEPAQTGPAVIAQYLKTLPGSPGVYRMIDAAGTVIYVREARNRKGDYFGPFASAGAVNRTINMLERAFLLRSCSDPVFESRTRPCLLHQIKRCSAPCTGEIGPDDYGALVEEATRFLKGE